MGKKLLFNYFMHKACCIEQELLGIQDERATLLAVIFSKFSVPHQHATGCCEETVYMTDPKFAQELFIILCIDAKKHGDNLVEAFRFVPWTLYYKGSILSGIEDKDLTNYLDKTLFPAVCDSILKPFYRALIPDKTVEQLQEVYYRQNRWSFRDVMDAPLILPAENEQTAMIDRAWERLSKDATFINLLSLTGKHSRQGLSYAYMRYADDIDELLNK